MLPFRAPVGCSDIMELWIYFDKQLRVLVSVSVNVNVNLYSA